MAKKDDYSAKDITSLEYPEQVRDNVGMYLGDSKERGLHQAVYELVSNGVDEFINGFCDQITPQWHWHNIKHLYLLRT